MTPEILIEVAQARGSTPRDAGAWMLVGASASRGTIGGGQMEYMAIDAARAMLRRGEGAATLDIPLGPEIGQCCGGRVQLRLRRADPDEIAAREAAERAARPAVMVHGAGHVGRALCAALALLPLRVTLAESRPAELAAAPAGVATLLAAIPEAAAQAAEAGTAHAIMTHDHAADFLIAAQALGRGDAPWVGMIGSATKRATFARWARARGLDPAPLVCPIGGASGDKRPAVIAALTAADIIRALTRAQSPVERA